MFLIVSVLTRKILQLPLVQYFLTRIFTNLTVHPKQNKFLPATVIDEDRNNVYVHYASHSSHWDEWLPRESGRLAPYGHKSKKKSRFPYDYRRIQEVHYERLYTPNNRKAYNKNKSGSMDDSSLNRFKQKLETIEDIPLIVKDIRGDGNCLFRAISHQIYGTSEHHQMIREKCVEYMMIEKRFFKNFIVISDDCVGNTDDDDDNVDSGHMQYFQNMKKLGTWGGDPEIQAAVEIYYRPIHMYYFKESDDVINIIKRGPDQINVTNSADRNGSDDANFVNNTSGTARMSHRDSEEASSRLGQPLRLHYEGYNHYNSIVVKPSGSTNRICNRNVPTPGRTEDIALANARSRRRHYENTLDENREGKVDEGGQKVSNVNNERDKSNDREDGEQLLMLMRGDVKFIPVQIDDEILFIEDSSSTGLQNSSGGAVSKFDEELKLALEVSKMDAEKGGHEKDGELTRALKASMELHTKNMLAEDEAVAKAIAESQGFDYNSEEYQIQLAIEESKKIAQRHKKK
jgi:hypothetical protein